MPAAKREPHKKRYEVRNWKRYNKALVNRGDFTFWFSEEVVDAWEHENEAKKNGRPFTYSDVAIETLLTIRELFRLPYRQTEGFGRALAKLLLEQVDAEVETFYGDGAYDTWAVREHLEEEKIYQLIPPRKNAVIKQHGNSSADPIERDECVRQIRCDVKKSWKESIGYHRRSLAETAMSRLKGAFGDRLKNREPPNQTTELALRCKILNAFVSIGMPLGTWG